MAWPIAAVAAISAAGTAASAVGARKQAKAQAKAQEEARDQQLNSIKGLRDIRNGLVNDVLTGGFLGRYGGEEIFGVKPEEIDLEDSLVQSIAINRGSLNQIQNLVDETNRLTSESSLDRAVRFDPNFSTNLSQLSDSARQLLRGEIPTDVVDTIIRDRAGFAGAAGVPGTQGPLVARDLGRTSLDLIGQGASLFQQVNAIRDQVDPVQRQIASGSFLLSPQQQIEADIANNVIRSSQDPTAAKLFDIQFRGQREEQFAESNVTVPVDNTLGATFSGIGGALTGLVGSGLLSGIGGGGGGQQAAAGQSYAPQFSLAGGSPAIYYR